MALFKKDRREPVPPAQTDVHDTSVGTAADVEAVMKKYDRESNTRVWEGLPKLVIRWLMVAFSAYCIIDTVFLSTRQEVRLPMFVGLILLFGFLTFPARKGDERVNHMPWYDIVLLIAGPGAYFFYAVNAQNVVQMSARVMQNDLYMIIGLIGILALVELCRRCVGLPILCVAGVLLVYTFFNLGGSADFKMTLYQVIRTMFYTTNGIFGGPVNVCAKFIVVFIIFGAFLERTGIASFFISLASFIGIIWVLLTKLLGATVSGWARRDATVSAVGYTGVPEAFSRLGAAVSRLMADCGAEYADCYCWGIPAQTMAEAGFCARTEDDLNIIPNYLTPPLCENTEYYFFTSEPAAFTMFKADGDQDRPNIRVE